MNCPHEHELVDRLLVPEFAELLHTYGRRLELDPHYLEYHDHSVAVTLRRALGADPNFRKLCNDCEANPSLCCHAVRALKIALKTRRRKTLEPAIRTGTD